MGLSRSLGAGASSLRAHQTKFEVISNNIANSNTIGFKSSKVNFAEQLSQTIVFGQSPDINSGVGTGGVNPKQVGLGVKVGSITRDMGQGVTEITNRPLDLAINGDGFFTYNFNGRQMFSRAGALNRDTNGYLVDSASGSLLQGYNVQVGANGVPELDSSGNNILARQVNNIRIEPGTISQPKQTQNIEVKGNLDRGMAIDESKTTSIQVFDNTGGSRELALTFTKTSETTYGLTGTIDGTDVTLSEVEVVLNNDGTLLSPTNVTVTAADLNAALGSTLFDDTKPKDINLQFGDPKALTTNSITNFSGVSDVTTSYQDGYQTGELISLAVDQNGKIRGSFTNGQNEILGQVIIAKFTNPSGLLSEGSNFFTQTTNSGNPNIGTALENFPSVSIQGSALEQSNTDLTEQFTDMISTQRGFEAASRTITVTDQILQEITNLKR